MSWIKISDREVCALPMGTPIKLIMNGEEHLGRIGRDASVGGMVRFDPDIPYLPLRGKGWWAMPQQFLVERNS